MLDNNCQLEQGMDYGLFLMNSVLLIKVTVIQKHGAYPPKCSLITQYINKQNECDSQLQVQD